MKKAIISILPLVLLTPLLVMAQDFDEAKKAPKAEVKHSEPVLTKTQVKRKSVQSGEIKLESANRQKDPYETGLESALEFLTSLQESIKSLSAGSTSRPKEISPEAVHFLTATYLHCSINKGICKFFLDSLLEADVINARLDKNDKCPVLRKFWKDYLDNDLEGRHQYATKIGFLAETGEFNGRTRPKYIKCTDTVKAERAGSMSDTEFFKSRYADKSKLESVEKTIARVKELKDKKINVFNEIINLK